MAVSPSPEEEGEEEAVWGIDEARTVTREALELRGLAPQELWNDTVPPFSLPPGTPYPILCPPTHLTLGVRIGLTGAIPVERRPRCRCRGAPH